MAAFAVTLVVSNISSTKVATIHLLGWRPSFDGGTFLFPLTYIFGDVLTEVYGYARSRRVIWVGLAASLGSALVLGLVSLLPTDPSSPTRGAFESVAGFVPQIVIASLAAFFLGEFLNSFVLAKLKLLTNGRWLWTRTIGSTLIGQGVDTLTFSFLAFGWGVGALPPSVFWSLVAFNYGYKLALEVLLTPLTYLVVGRLKRAEGVDHFDRGTNFNPFRLRVD